MTLVAPVFELSLVGIFDPGVPHKERIVLRPTQSVDLSNFALIVGIYINQAFVPLKDQFFWIGSRVVAPPCWLVIYTDTGEYVETKHQETGEPVHIGHWGRATTMFGRSYVTVDNNSYPLGVAVLKIGGLSTWSLASPAPAVAPSPLLQNLRRLSKP